MHSLYVSSTDVICQYFLPTNYYEACEMMWYSNFAIVHSKSPDDFKNFRDYIIYMKTEALF